LSGSYEQVCIVDFVVLVPMGISIVHVQASTAYYSTQFADAQHDFEQLVSSDPDNRIYLCGLADSCYAQHDFEHACTYYQQAAINACNGVEREALYFNTGCAQAQLRQFKEALLSFEQVVALNAHNERAQKNIEILKKLLEQQKQSQSTSKNDQEKSSKKNEASNNTGNDNDKNNKHDQQRNGDHQQQQQGNDQKQGQKSAQQPNGKPNETKNESGDDKNEQSAHEQSQSEHSHPNQPSQQNISSSKDATQAGQKQLSKPLAQLLGEVDRLDQQGHHRYVQALVGQRDEQKETRGDHDW
jgi:Ca-activated chloride channel family protein